MQLVKPSEVIDMQVIVKRTGADRAREYRGRMGDKGRQRDATRKRKTRAARIPEFVCIDGEGQGRGKNHTYVLLSAYDKHGWGSHIVNRNGIGWEEAFQFLYGLFTEKPNAAFVGFYLGYDFNRILATLPAKTAHSLLTKEGKAARKIKEGRRGRSKLRSVKCERWEIDTLGLKRLAIRPRPEGCNCYELAQKCSHKQHRWMYICDSGPFYQMSFLKVIDPGNWKDDPGGPVCTQVEYNTILVGKDDRDSARLGPKMIYYNRLENIVHARVMERLANGFKSIGLTLAKDQWYGPGAVAARWLGQHGAPKRTQLRQKDNEGKPALMPKSFWEHCRQSYFGGWFEIFSHGLILGKTYNYDIHNAYPFATTKLPHICRDCRYTHGEGPYKGRGEYVLLYGTVFGKCDRIGPMPNRTRTGSILRPAVTKGWYWQFEIAAARRTGLVQSVKVEQWCEFIPCSHPKPFTEVEDLYYKRLEVGSHGAQGMAIKNNNNSIYGKFAQASGAAPYCNWFYASYITAHCRAQILDAIATHPGKTDSVLMVATDGICFDSPHPTLALSDKLGDWEESIYTDLCLFKPGVYWHREGKERLAKVKSRGVPKEEFQKAIESVEPKFRRFLDEKNYPGWDVNEAIERGLEEEGYFELWLSEYSWPRFTVYVNFRMKSCLQALNEGQWDRAGGVMERFPLGQDSSPYSKRYLGRIEWDPKKKNQHRHGVFYNEEKKRIDSIIHTLPVEDRQTYYHLEVERPKPFSLGFGLDGETAFAPLLEAAGILRDAPANYDLPIEEGLPELPEEFEWVTVWGG